MKCAIAKMEIGEVLTVPPEDAKRAAYRVNNLRSHHGMAFSTRKVRGGENAGALEIKRLADNIPHKKYPLLEMRVGESWVCPPDMARRAAIASHCYKNKFGMAFKRSRQPDGSVIFVRIDPPKNLTPEAQSEALELLARCLDGFSGFIHGRKLSRPARDALRADLTEFLERVK